MTRAIVIGASAGGVQALLAILTALPPNFALPHPRRAPCAATQ